MYNVFNSQAEAIAAQEVDYLAWKASRPQEPANYWEVTTAWATPQQRITDGKWVYPVCPESNQNHNQEPLDPNWFPTD